MIHHFTLPIPDKISLNKIYSGVHWGTRKAVAKRYHEAIAEVHSRAQIMEVAMKCLNRGPVHIIVRVVFKNRPLDCSNCAFMAKMVEDGLVSAGVLKDDSPKYVRAMTLISVVDKKNPRIEVGIW